MGARIFLARDMEMRRRVHEIRSKTAVVESVD
jgi:hypothetical protein